MHIIKKNKEKYINTLKKMYKGGGNNKTKQENYFSSSTFYRLYKWLPLLIFNIVNQSLWNEL